jgi:hypothetical protein
MFHADGTGVFVLSARVIAVSVGFTLAGTETVIVVEIEEYT